MRLSDRFEDFFEDSVRRRGQKYFFEGRVELLCIGIDDIEAMVEGSMDYDVSISFQPERVEVFCECPYFEKWVSPCKHLWAAMLKLDAEGYQPEADLEGAELFSNLNYYGDDLLDDEEEFSGSLQPQIQKVDKSNNKSPSPSWQTLINKVSHYQSNIKLYEKKPDLPLCFFTINTQKSLQGAKLAIEIELRYRKKDGSTGRQIHISSARQFLEHGSQLEQQIFSILFAHQDMYSYYGSKDFYVPIQAADTTLPLMEMDGRTKVRKGQNGNEEWPLIIDKGDNWRFVVNLLEDGGDFVMQPILRRDNIDIPLENIEVIFHGNPMSFFFEGRFSRLEGDFPFAWITFFRGLREPCRLPGEDVDNFYDLLSSSIGRFPELSWPKGFWMEDLRESTPTPFFQLEFSSQTVTGRLNFEYPTKKGRHTIGAFQPGDFIVEFKERRRIYRDLVFEKKTIETLNLLSGIEFDGESYIWRLNTDGLMDNIRQIIEEGIEVLAEDNKRIKTMSNLNISVTSGIDWFDLTGKASFGDMDVSIMMLMETLQNGNRFVRLSNGEVGMFPERWLEKNGWILELGQKNKDKESLQFSKAHGGVIQTLSKDEEFPASFDVTSKEFFKKLAAFSGIKDLPLPKPLKGNLRKYQKAGFAWLTFLNDFGFGGILADDMGLGKTVQALAMLLHSMPDSKGKPSLIVVPASLIFNWQDEVKKFAPSLKIIDYTGLNRKGSLEKLGKDKIILTTYGILRRDVERLNSLDLFYVILDEAQAMKNANSVTAKAIRSLKSDHRVALSGTPVENHLGELWSLMAFLNPGLLWRKKEFYSRYCRKKEMDSDDMDKLKQLVTPFILRRKKEEVLAELPPKIEQTIHCEMSSEQRKIYDDIRDYYRLKLLKHIDSKGMNKSKIMVLEGLLRLRQTACHPALVKPQSRIKSAKLDTLIDMMCETMEEGYKALIFSQFTTMLAIIEREVKKHRIEYAYLDGRTRKRKEAVERFQGDPSCKLFLISLKAGGLGLNLTAASYVFLFDPWWNPAVEMQAIDRTHRIGQKQKVFTYRLITRDTVEEKIIELKQKKEKLASSIITSDSSIIKKISREDIEYLFA